MQKKYEDGMRDMEAKVEELTQEISQRAEYLQKEQVEIEKVRNEVQAKNQYLKDQRLKH